KTSIRLADGSTRLSVPSSSDRHAQEGRRNAGSVLALVLADEQLFELSLQVGSSTRLFRGFERIHGGPVVFPEGIQESRRRAGEVEGERVSHEGDVLCRNSRGGKSLGHVALDAPRHGADE